MARIILEVAVDDPAGLAAAIAGGADRIELCSALALGGLTPSPGLMALAAQAPVPVVAMIRPRAGGFCHDADELAQMEHDIAAARAAGLAGLVFGALTTDHRLDRAANARLIAAATGMDCVLHRAIDLCPDPEAALDDAVDLGFARILSSGGALAAPGGVAVLDRLFARAAGRITLMPGAGITAHTLPALSGLPLTDIHASCAGPVPADARDLAMGFAAPGAKRTEAARVAALRAALDGLSVPH